MTTIRNLQEFLDFMGVETIEQADRQVYKSTACGGWCKAEPTGISIGTIVEGSDAEFEDFLAYPFTNFLWDAVWALIELAAEIAWDQANREED